MHFRFGNMESFLIVGMVLFLYTTLVKTASHPDVIKGRDEDKINHVDVGSALKREIIHALVNILHDELEKKTTVQLLKKQIMDKFTANDLRNELTKKRATGILSERREVNKATANDEHKAEKDTISPPGFWKRHQEKSDHAWRKDEDKDVAADNIMRRRLVRGPPGLWGKDVSEESKLVSDHGPPGLWGRDAAKALLTAEENEKFSDELSNSRLFRKDDHRPSLWARDAANVMLAAEENDKFSDEQSSNRLLRKDEQLSNNKPSSV